MRALRVAEHRQAAAGLPAVAPLLGQDGVRQDAQEPPDVQVRLGVSAEGVPPIPVWLAVAAAAPFC